LTTLFFGVVGYIDDYRKVVQKNPKGLSARQKLLGQTLTAFLAAYAIYAFCRAADDAVDESVHLGVAEQRRRLAGMGRRLDDLFDGRPSSPVDAALADVGLQNHGP
jgi:hypothetical protein